MILRLALRNLWRNGRRTALTSIGIALAMALLLTSRGIQAGAWNSMIRGAIQSTAGHVVVQDARWQQDREAAQVVTEASAVQAALQAAYPEAVVVRRTFFGGLLTSPTAAVAVSLEGIEPEAEAGISLLDERIVEGTWVVDDRGILIGADLARSLKVGVGDKVVLMAQAGTPEMESRLYRVVGLFRSGVGELDAFGALASIGSTQELMGGADVAHQVAAVLPDAGGSDVDIAPALAALAGRTGLDVLPWTQALPMLQQQRELDEAYAHMIQAVMAFIVVLGLINTVLMSVMERMREFGVMLAVGMRPFQLARLVALEGALMGLLGGLLGLVLAALAAWPLITIGVDFADMMGDASPVGPVPIDSVVRAAPSAVDWAVAALAAVVLSGLAALLPARRATQLQPVDAIRHL